MENTTLLLAPELSVPLAGPDYVAMLDHELDIRRTRNPAYSLRAFARDLNLPPHHLSEILRGKRGISERLAAKIAGKLGLTDERSDLFCDLVAARHARSQKARTAARARLAQRQVAQEYEPLTLDAFKYISDWSHFGILELMKVKSFRANLAWIATALGVSESTVQAAIERLERLGLLQREGATWKATHRNIWAGQEAPSQAVKRFHEQILNKGTKALYQQPLAEREFASVLFAISRDKLPHYKRRLREIVLELDAEIESSGERDDVYCFAVQLFRVGKGDAT